MAWVVVGALILGGLLLKAIVDSDTKIYRCPYCNLVIKNNTTNCPRCRKPIGWEMQDD